MLRIVKHLEKTAGKDRSDFLRFADDMTVLAWSPSGLFKLINVIWAAISDRPNGCLADPRSDSNLHLNLAKIGPEPLREMVRKTLACHRRTSKAAATGITELEYSTAMIGLEALLQSIDHPGAYCVHGQRPALMPQVAVRDVAMTAVRVQATATRLRLVLDRDAN